MKSRYDTLVEASALCRRLGIANAALALVLAVLTVAIDIPVVAAACCALNASWLFSTWSILQGAARDRAALDMKQLHLPSLPPSGPYHLVAGDTLTLEVGGARACISTSHSTTLHVS